LRVPEQYVGTAGTCKKCGARIVVSLQPAAAAKAPPPPPSLPPFHAFRVSVSGVDETNTDGTSRQRWINQLRLGDRLVLARDPTSRYDPNAVAVRCTTGEQIGYLSKSKAGEVIPYLDAGQHVQGEVVGFSGGTPYKPTRGVDIQVATVP
jgi:hypothetical protein